MPGRSREDDADSTRTMTERSRLLDEIGALEIRLLALGLPEQTSSLLDYDLTLQQIRAFAFILARGKTSISKVGDALGIRPNVATGIIQRLVDRGLIERHEDPVDRRIRLLTVTDRGLALIDELSGIVLAKARELLDRLSDEQLHQMRDILAAMELQQQG
jgi:DNA-binding MarR family transcriptional regulator